jgi:hypothetical protein
MDMNAITEALRARVGSAGGLGATLLFDCGDEGVVFIDGRSQPHLVGNDARAGRLHGGHRAGRSGRPR